MVDANPAPQPRLARKAALGGLAADAVTATTLAGDPIVATLTHAPGTVTSVLRAR